MPATRPGPLLGSYAHYSPLPDQIRTGATDDRTPCILGVDEAGRGPVLGPMVYGVCYCPKEEQAALKDLGFADSKTLDKGQREAGLEQVIGAASWVGWAVKVMSPQDISSGMLRGVVKYNLNQQALDATIELIRGVLAQGINVVEIYVDTVGPPDGYRAKLRAQLPQHIDITVAKKADALYPIVSAASICAKVSRDAVLERWEYAEPGLGETLSTEYGSGYPSDPNTVAWLKANLDPIFGFPGICRFSWGTTDRLLDEMGRPVRWMTEDAQEAMAKRVTKKQRTLTGPRPGGTPVSPSLLLPGLSSKYGLENLREFF